MRLMVDWLRPVLTASMRLDQCVAPFGVFSSVSRTTCSIFSSPISRGAPGRGSSPSPATPSAIKRLRQRPTVNPVVRNFAATAALLAPPAHSKTIRRGRPPNERCETAALCAPTRLFALSLPPAHASSAVHDETPCLTIERLPSICNLLVTQETRTGLINRRSLARLEFKSPALRTKRVSA